MHTMALPEFLWYMRRRGTYVIMRSVSIREMKTYLSRLIRVAANGKPLIFGCAGKPMVKLMAAGTAKAGALFEGITSAEAQESDDLCELQAKKFRAFDPIELAGAWPGDEPLEDLMAQLD